MKSNLLLLFIFAATLGGCVVGQELSMDYGKPAGEITEVNSVGVAVQDQRPYVLSGDKNPWFIGKYRGGFGNPFNVSTDNDEPLADVLSRGMTDALLSNGFGTSTDPDRTVAVTIHEWNFDGYQNGRFWYELEVQVNSSEGVALDPVTVKDEKYIDGSFWKGAKGGFEKQMPMLYKQAIDKVLTKNPDVMTALRTINPVAPANPAK